MIKYVSDRTEERYYITSKYFIYHSVGSPAIIHKTGGFIHRVAGNSHKLNGFASKLSMLGHHYYLNNNLHCITGPAAFEDGAYLWYISGTEYTKKEFEYIMKVTKTTKGTRDNDST